MIVTLAEIVAPLSVVDFLAAISARQTRLFRGNDPNRFRGVLSCDTLMEALGNGAILREDTRVTVNRQEVPRIFFAEGATGIRVEKIAQLLSNGASLIVNRLPRALPQIASLCADVRYHSGERTDVVAFVTDGPQGALDLHFDNPDVLALQIEGSKRWRCYGPPVINPVRDMTRPSPPTDDGLFFDEELRAGDMLLVPAGCWHTCENSSGRSFHVSISLEPLCVQRGLRVLAHHLLDDEQARQPLLRAQGPADAAVSATHLKARMIDHIARLPDHDLIKMHQAYKNES